MAIVAASNYIIELIRLNIFNFNIKSNTLLLDELKLLKWTINCNSFYIIFFLVGVLVCYCLGNECNVIRVYKK